MTNYKTGDKVRYTGQDNRGAPGSTSNFTMGKVYTVLTFTENSANWNDLTLLEDNFGRTNSWRSTLFEPVDEEYESLRETLTELRADLEKSFNGIMAQAEAAEPGIEALRDELEELEGRRNKLMDRANRYDAQLTAIERILTEGEKNEA